MKNLIFLTLVFLAKFVSAQQTIMLSGVFKENYRVVKLGKEVQRILFIKNKGHFKVPESGYGYFLNLTKDDATKKGFDDVLVISLTDNFFQSNINTVTLDVAQLSVNEPTVFYTKQNDVEKDISYNKRIFSNPTLKDTVSWDEITNSDFHYTKQWIDNIDNEKEVTLKSYILYETDRGGGSTPHFSKIKMKKLAQERLHSVANLFDILEDESWTKMQWQDWFERTVNYQEPTLKDCNPNNYRISDVYKYDDGNTMLYGADPITSKVLAIQSLPYNVDQFKDRQMVVIDSLSYKKYDYYRDDQKQVHNVRTFESLNNNLYFIDFYANWSSFQYDSIKEAFVFKEKKEIHLPDVLDKRTDYSVSHSQTNQNLMFTIISNQKSKEYAVAILKTQTGEKLKVKNLKDLLTSAGANFTNKIEILPLKYGLKSKSDFVFGIKHGDDYFLVKTDQHLADVKLIKTTKEISDATLFVNAKTIDVLKSDRSTLHKISFDSELKTMLSNQHTVIQNWYYDEDGVIIFDGSNYKLFAPYRLSLLSGINLHTLNNQLETIKKECVFQFLPLEEPEYNNMVHLQYATKLQGWVLLFRLGSDLRYAKVN